MIYHDAPYELQDVVGNYIIDNLPEPPASDVSDVPVFKAGEYDFEEKSGIHIAVPEAEEQPELSGRLSASVVVAVSTIREISIGTHREYCKAVLDLMTAPDLKEKLQALSTRLRFNQVYMNRRFVTGAGGNMRWLELHQDMKISFVPQ